MIRPTKKLHYWDSCVFLAFLKNEKDKINDCISVLKAAENGQVIIVTSALTFIEVVKLEKGQPKLPKESEEKIRYFFPHEWIYIYDVDIRNPLSELMIRKRRKRVSGLMMRNPLSELMRNPLSELMRSPLSGLY